MNKRIWAGLIDIVVTCLIQVLIVSLFLFKPIFLNESKDTIFPYFIYITYISMLYMVLRDNIGSSSIGKKIMKLSIVIEGTSIKLKFYKRLLRNITWLLGPVEIICYIIHKKRIGDFITNSEVVSLSNA